MRRLLPLLLLTHLPLGWSAPGKPKSSLAYQYHSRGVEQSSHKKWEEAQKSFQSAIDLNPAFVSSYIEYARASVMLGRRQQGLSRLNAAMELTRARDDRARIQRERENLSEIFYTNDTFQLYQNGLNYLRLDRPGNAVDSLERALKVEPENVLVLVAFGKALRQEDRSKEAIAALERALKLNEGKREVRLDLAEFTLPENPSRSLELLQPLAAPPLEERSVILRAQALSATQRNQDAIEAVRELFEIQPASIYAAFWLGKLYEREKGGAWNARKYLMTFIRRADFLLASQKDENGIEIRQLKAVRLEADQILARVNKSLE